MTSLARQVSILSMIRKNLVLFTLSASAFVFGCRAAAEQAWIEVRSPHFRVLTNGSGADGRKVANEFEQMRYVFATRFHDDKLESGAPLTIVAAKDGDTMKSLEPHFWKESKGNAAGEFHSGWEKKFATVRLDTWGDANSVVVYHEYTHSVLHRIFHWLPVWLDEGLAEFYGYTWFRPDRIMVGAPTLRSQVLQNRGLLPTKEVLEVTPSSKEYHDSRADLFYAQSWAMVHYMTFGPGMDHGAKINDFIHKLETGEPQEQAFVEVFGDLKAFDKTMQKYAGQESFNAARLAPDPGMDAKTFAVRKLTAAEAEYEMGCFRIGAGEVETGRASLQKAMTLDPTLAGPYEELAYLDYREGKDEEASKGWSEALKLDSSRWRSLFALTMVQAGPKLLSLPDAEQAAVLSKMRRVNTLAPLFAPAYVETALLEWHLGAMQKAYSDAHQAETLEPWRAGYHLLTARILLQGNQPAIAAKYARVVGEHWKGPDHNEAVELWAEVPAAQQGKDPAPIWDVPEGATIAQGTLKSVACGSAPGERAMFVFQPDKPKGATALKLKSDNRLVIGFSDTFWWGEDHFTPCHHLEGHRAMIAYEPEEGVVVDVEVRDDLPAVAKVMATGP